MHRSTGNTTIAACLLAFGCAAAVLPAWAADSGTAKLVSGDVRVERAGVQTALRVGDNVQAQDRIVVGAGGAAGITLRDDTRISLGPNSVLLINQFAFDPQTLEGQVDTSILRGAMRYITGLVARQRPQAVRVSTSTTTIGIRGTDFIVEVGEGQ